MGAFGIAVRVMFKRPFIILFLAFLCLAYYIINLFNPFFTILMGLSAFGGGNVFESIISFLQLILNPAILLRELIFILGAVIIGSIFIGFILSGYLNIINNTLEGKPKFRGEFFAGVKQYFFRICTISFRVLVFGFLFILFTAVALVPAVIVTRASASGQPGLLASAVLLDIVTLIVLFFGFMFFRIYSFFWYPAAFSGKGGTFKMGKRVADAHFWSIVGRFFVFDMAFIVFQLIYLYASYLLSGQSAENMLYPAAVFIGNWVFKTLFLAAFITYVFTALKIYSENKEETAVAAPEGQ